MLVFCKSMYKVMMDSITTLETILTLIVSVYEINEDTLEKDERINDLADALYDETDYNDSDSYSANLQYYTNSMCRLIF